MSETLRIFVSATNDLEGERAVIGRALAELPVHIRAEIRRTPAVGAKHDDIYEQIANCDRVYFLLGQDITAPAGAEWHLALELERSIFPLRSSARLTPAAQQFARNTLAEWTTFRSPASLAQIVMLDLSRMLNHPRNRYGLTLSDLELLGLHGERLKKQAAQRASATVRDPGGAEGGGVLLDNMRNEPVDGVPIDEEWV
ncbi:hypothetical protein KFU94_45585 [Chloroflexi bacterium TSY]|nr:hypothetical protein [Chloroflexi bacterium TSY]